MIVYNYDLDMVSGSAPVIVHVHQYDDDFRIVFKLFSSQGTFTISDGTTAEIRGTKLDGNGFTANNVSLSGTNATVYGHKQMTAISGKNMFELVLLRGNFVLSTANFVLDVERAALDAGTVKSNSVLKELNDIINGATRAQTAASRAETALTKMTYTDTNNNGNVKIGGSLDGGNLSGELEPNNGLTVLWNFVVPIGLLSLYIRGNLNGELQTSAAYVSFGTIPNLGDYMSHTVLKSVRYNNAVRGQINVSASGNVQLGYTRNDSDDQPYDLPNNMLIYIQESFVIF